MGLIFYNGQLLIVGGELAMSLDCCCEQPAPCSCIAPYNDWPTTTFTLTVDAAAKAQFITCAGGQLDGWDGTLIQVAGCDWTDGVNGVLALGLGGVDPDCYWELWLDVGGSLWVGRKTTGLTTEGVYTKVSGTCDLASATITEQEDP